MPIIRNEKYLREKEVCSKYCKSIHWFRRARRLGNGPPYHKLHGSIYYIESELEEWFVNNLEHYE